MPTLPTYATTAVTCINPKLVHNRYTHDTIVVPCGKCTACLNAKSTQKKTICELESSCHSYTFFVTLTYNNDHVPTAEYYFNKDIDSIEVFDTTYRKRYRSNTRKYKTDNRKPNSKNYGKILSLQLNDVNKSNICLLSMKQIKGTKESITSNIFKPNTLFYANKNDLQKYIKRLRFQIYSKTGEQIRFYAVSEYGPKSFRPHFHILFYFDKPETLSVFRKHSIESWQYGNVVSELSKGGSSNYVSTYVNSFICLPYILKTPHFMPFTTHSKYFGVGYLRSLKKDVYSNPSVCFDGKLYQYPKSLVSIYRTSTLDTIFFPKVYGYNEFDAYTLRRLYTIYYDISKELGYLPTPSEAMPYINNPKHFHVYKALDLTKNWELVPTLVSRVYNTILTSSHFYNFVCDCNPYLFDDWIINIRQYYNKQSLKRLNKFYICQMEYSNAYPDQGYDIFYPDHSNFQSWKSNLKHHSVYKLVKNLSDQISIDHVKHKELNDLHNILNSK